MKIREAKIQYNTISDGEVFPLSTPNEVYLYSKRFLKASNLDPEQEHFCVIALDRKNKPKGVSVVSSGTLTASLVHPREVFRYAVLQNAAAVIVFHNHPSGDPAPSRADIQVTRQIRESAKIIGIDLIEHLIIGDLLDDPQNIGHYSFNEAGLI